MQMLIKPLKQWTGKEYVSYLPPAFGITIVLASLFLFVGNAGTVAVVSLFAMTVSVTPFMIYSYYRAASVRAVEDQLPNFLRDLVETSRSGMTFNQAIAAVAKSDYSKLTPEVVKIHNQLTWGLSLDKALLNFAERMKESMLIKRNMRIIIEAYRSGGDVIATMEAIATDATIIKEAEKERRSRLSQHVAVMYIIYFMFIAIVLVLSKVLLPLTEMNIGITGGGSASPCQGYSGGLDFICTMFTSTCSIFGFGDGAICYYRSIFFYMVIIQGVFAGLVAGQIGENSISAGTKHSLIMAGAGFTVFLITRFLGIA